MECVFCYYPCSTIPYQVGGGMFHLPSLCRNPQSLFCPPPSLFFILLSLSSHSLLPSLPHVHPGLCNSPVALHLYLPSPVNHAFYQRICTTSQQEEKAEMPYKVLNSFNPASNDSFSFFFTSGSSNPSVFSYQRIGCLLEIIFAVM